jgi:hypothetical protein
MLGSSDLVRVRMVRARFSFRNQFALRCFMSQLRQILTSRHILDDDWMSVLDFRLKSSS